MFSALWNATWWILYSVFYLYSLSVYQHHQHFCLVGLSLSIPLSRKNAALLTERVFGGKWKLHGTHRQSSPFCFHIPGALHLCTILGMKVRPKPRWTSVSLGRRQPRPSPIASNLLAFLCLSVALTPVASRLLSPEAPDRMAVDNLFFQEKNWWGQSVGGGGPWRLLASSSVGDMPRLIFSPET